jgi:hypothetical protein
MKKATVFSVIIFTFLFSCSSPKNSTGNKNEGKSYNNLFIIANTADIEVRVRLEKGLAAAAEAKGYKAVKSIDVIPPVLSDPKPPSKEELVNKVNATGCDALCIVYFLKNGEEVSHTQGINFKGTEPMLTNLVGLLVGYKKFDYNKGDYDPKYKKDVSQPGYYTREKGFYIISELFDATSAENVYSEKSDFFDDADLVPFSTGYMAGFVKHLEMEKKLKK